MKKILLNIRREDFENMKPVLEDLNFIIIAKDAKLIQAKVFVPDADIDEVIEKLREPLDLRFKENLIEVSTPDFVISSTLSRIDKKKTNEKTPVEQLISTADNYSCVDYWTLLLTAIAGLIALTGLFLNNVPIVIGAMLLCPLLGPIHSFAIYSATGKTREALQSLSVLFIFLGLVFIVSVLATFLLGTIYGFISGGDFSLILTEEILLRTGSSPIYIIMAVLLGIASMIALTKGFSESIAGVAVAAALLPPTVVAGISLVMINDKILGAILLALDNVIGLVAGAMIATLIIGVAPRRGEEQRVAKHFIKRAVAIIIILIALLSLLSYLF